MTAPASVQAPLAVKPFQRRLTATVSLLERHSLAVLALVLLIACPLMLDMFRLGLMGKYLSLSFCAVGIVLIWGHGGILSLGQGIFFGMGSYLMAMFLKLEAAGAQDSSSALAAFYDSKLPDFMVWNSIEELPWWWAPFDSLAITVVGIIVIPAITAFILAYAVFRKRVGGVYFSIITLALASMLAIVIVGQQGYTGGINGITDFKTMLGLSLQTDDARRVLYFVNALLLIGAVAVGRFILRSRLGRVLVAIRDREDRVRFSGYDPAMFKGFIFAVAAVFSAIGGSMYTLQVGLASPSMVGIVPSIEMVIYTAVGGRLSVVGAVVGTLLVGTAKTFFSENFVEFWLYFIGGIFIAVVMFLPTGLAGLMSRLRGDAQGGRES